MSKRHRQPSNVATTVKRTVDATAVEVKKKSPGQYISERQKYRMQEDMFKLRIAIDDAENTSLFNREQLHRIFREIDKDPHLTSQWETRVMKTIDKEFKIIDDATEEEDKEGTKVLQSLWFMQLMKHILDSKKWGFSLIELGPIVDGKPQAFRLSNGRVMDAVSVVDRDYVKPEFGFIGRDPSSFEGLAFDGSAFDDQLIFVGERHSFGFLMKVVKYILFKDNCLANWSEWAEIFGMDVRVGKTSAEGTARREFLNTIKNIGSSGYGVIDEDDSLDFTGTSRSDAFKVYQELMKTTDSNVSKAVLGQDVISNNTGQVVGEVGETVSNLYGDSDAKFLMWTVNDTVLPKLTRLGVYNYKGKSLKWDTTEKITLVEQSDIDAKISTMGWRPTAKYVTDKYGTEVDAEPTNKPVDEGAAVGGKKGPLKDKKPVKKATNVMLVNLALSELYEDPASVE